MPTSATSTAQQPQSSGNEVEVDKQDGEVSEEQKAAQLL